MKKKQILQSALLILVVVILSGVWLHRQAIADWARLRGYQAPANVAQLASDDTMTAKARHLFYVNHPNITTGLAFSNHCPSGGEKTVVLGCYIGNDAGIYLYKVSDSRLAGVEQVTAAHETLHAAYRRLSNAQRTQVDGWLTAYYQHDLSDQRIKDTIAAYKKSEPNDVVNEMHSVFGTEVANLPAPLENYYKQYFSNRSKITDYTARYQAEFTGRDYERKAYDTQLDSLKQQIATDQAALAAQKTSLDTQNQQLQTYRSSGQTSAYNVAVTVYNNGVNSYNARIATVRDLIVQYNAIVTKRNAIVLEEQQLTKALSSSGVTVQ